MAERLRTARPAGRDGPHVPRPRPVPAAPLLAGRHDGSPPPAILESKLPIVTRIARSLPGGYRFTPARDLAAEIEWAKNRRIEASAYLAEATAAEREPRRSRLELMARAFADYERAKARAGRIDFEDMLGSHDRPARGRRRRGRALVRARKRWFSVDEYQDTNPLQERLLELWAGSSRDVCVVGDEDQTIYSFTGASSRYLRDFARNHPGHDGRGPDRELPLEPGDPRPGQPTDRRPRPPAGPGLRPVRAGRQPSSAGYADADAELAGLVRGIRARIAEGTDPGEIAVLVRINAQLAPIEAALTTAGIAYVVRGGRFYERPDVRAAIRAIERAGITASRSRLRRRRSRPSSPRPSGSTRGAGRPGRRNANGPPPSRSSSRSPGSCLAEAPGRRRRRPRPTSWPSSPRATPPSEPAHAGGSPCPRSIGPRASSGTRSSCPGSRRATCRSARRPAIPRPSPRSDACCTSRSPGHAATWRSRGRPDATVRAAAKGAGGRRASWPKSASARTAPGPASAVRDRVARPLPGRAAPRTGRRERSASESCRRPARRPPSRRSGAGAASAPGTTACRPT